jgi:TrmH family RNA methyltransferase
MTALDHIIFVLYQPQDLVNIGGVARVLGNFGLRQLRLVAPAAWDRDRAAGIAHQADAVLDAVTLYPDLPAALADCGLVAATTGRPRRVDYARRTPRTAAPDLLAAARADAPVAVLCGREDTGLPNDALDQAHLLLTIPTVPDNHSLNLAQAALVVAYELWQTALGPQAAAGTTALPDTPAEPPALGADTAAMLAAMESLLAAHVPARRLAYDRDLLRAVLLRARPRKREAARLAHLFRTLTPDP